MKYFGVKSLSSFFSVVCAIALPVILVLAIGGSAFFGIVTFSEKAENFITQEIQKDTSTSEEDLKDWEEFRAFPVWGKVLLFPYGVALVWLLILIVGRAKQLFDNLKKNILFNKANVELMKRLNYGAAIVLD